MRKSLASMCIVLCTLSLMSTTVHAESRLNRSEVLEIAHETVNGTVKNIRKTHFRGSDVYEVAMRKGSRLIVVMIDPRSKKVVCLKKLPKRTIMKKEVDR
ncbi:MAG TPA: PepSY domain-containing protein [Bacillales bacterium]|nr:PepSY domain-containing protein [Bacillales bacterium]